MHAPPLLLEVARSCDFTLQKLGLSRMPFAVAECRLLRRAVPELHCGADPGNGLEAEAAHGRAGAHIAPAASRLVQALLAEQVLELLRDLQNKYNLTFLFISHDLKIIKALCHDIIVMKDGVAVEAGPAKNILKQPQNPYTQDLLEATS